MSMIQKVRAIALAAILTSGTAEVLAGPIMHIHDSSGRLGTVDVATGNASLIGNMGVVMTDIAFDPSGNLYGMSFTGLYSINAMTAAVTFIGNHGISSGNALVFAADGTLYGAGNTTTGLFTINPVTGASTNLGSMGFASGGDLAFNEGNFYLASSQSTLVKIDLANLSNTSAVGSFGVADMFGLATGDDGTLYGVAGTSVYTINTATGAATSPVSFAGQGLGQAFGQSFFTEAGAVPEPGALALISLALALIGVMHMRPRRSRQAA